MDAEVHVVLDRNGGAVALVEADSCELWSSDARADGYTALVDLVHEHIGTLETRAGLLHQAMDMLGELGSSQMLRDSLGGANALALAAEIDAGMDGPLPTAAQCTCDGGPYSAPPPFPSAQCPIHGLTLVEP